MTSVKSVLAAPIHFLNREGVKQGVKNGIGLMTAVFGAIALNDLVHCALNKRDQSSEFRQPSGIIEKVSVAMLAAAKVSLVVNALVSVPGVKLISALTPFSKESLDKTFGPNINFEGNPWHPRHVVSIVGTGLAVPIFVRTIFRKVLPDTPEIERYSTSFWEAPHKTTFKEKMNKFWLKNVIAPNDRKFVAMALIVLASSRPVLHMGNQLCQKLLKR